MCSQVKEIEKVRFLLRGVRNTTPATKEEIIIKMHCMNDLMNQESDLEFEAKEKQNLLPHQIKGFGKIN